MMLGTVLKEEKADGGGSISEDYLKLSSYYVHKAYICKYQNFV
jgi:hypothetical protein